jgi:hypothetical protein
MWCDIKTLVPFFIKDRKPWHCFSIIQLQASSCGQSPLPTVVLASWTVWPACTGHLITFTARRIKQGIRQKFTWGESKIQVREGTELELLSMMQPGHQYQVIYWKYLHHSLARIPARLSSCTLFNRCSFMRSHPPGELQGQLRQKETTGYTLLNFFPASKPNV